MTAKRLAKRAEPCTVLDSLVVNKKREKYKSLMGDPLSAAALGRPCGRCPSPRAAMKAQGGVICIRRLTGQAGGIKAVGLYPSPFPVPARWWRAGPAFTSLRDLRGFRITLPSPRGGPMPNQSIMAGPQKVKTPKGEKV